MSLARTIVACMLICATPLAATAASSKVEPAAISYRYDADASLTFEDMVVAATRGPADSKFDVADVPVGNGNHWLYLTVARQHALPPQEWLLEVRFPNIDAFDARVYYGDGNTDYFSAGDEIAFATWPIDSRKPAIPLRLIGESDALVVFRIRNESPLIFPLALLTTAQLNESQRKEHFLYGVFYGAIFILALYNAGIYFSLRDPSYRYYILYILSFAVVQASTTGVGQQYLWPGLSSTTTRLALLAILLTNYFMVRFVIEFLDLRTHRPAIITPLRWLANLALLLAPFLLLPTYAYTQYSTHALNIVCMLAIVITTLSVLKFNRGPAIYLLASYAVLFSAITLALLFQTGLVEHYGFIDYSMSAAILIEAVILSIGLSARISQLRLAREESERARRIEQEQLSQQLIQAREQERASISKLLHDSVNHTLVVIRNKIGKLANTTTSERSTLTEETLTIDQMLNNAISEIRDISHHSHPQFVKHLGLETALRSLLGDTFDTSISWDLHFEDIKLDYDTELLLYRAVQELTTNIIKHARASECLVRLRHELGSNHVVFMLKDDGDGFAATERSWRFGLRTLNEHCKSLSGSLRVVSTPDQGTTVTITLPLHKDTIEI